MNSKVKNMQYQHFLGKSEVWEIQSQYFLRITHCLEDAFQYDLNLSISKEEYALLMLGPPDLTIP